MNNQQENKINPDHNNKEIQREPGFAKMLSGFLKKLDLITKKIIDSLGLNDSKSKDDLDLEQQKIQKEAKEKKIAKEMKKNAKQKAKTKKKMQNIKKKVEKSKDKDAVGSKIIEKSAKIKLYGLDHGDLVIEKNVKQFGAKATAGKEGGIGSKSQVLQNAANIAEVAINAAGKSQGKSSKEVEAGKKVVTDRGRAR